MSPWWRWPNTWSTLGCRRPKHSTARNFHSRKNIPTCSRLSLDGCVASEPFTCISDAIAVVIGSPMIPNIKCPLRIIIDVDQIVLEAFEVLE